MLAWPFILRELRQHLRNDQHLFGSRNLVMFLGVAAVLSLFAVMQGHVVSGKLVHMCVIAGCAGIICMNAFQLAESLFAGELEGNELGLLYLCGLSPRDLIVGRTSGAFLAGIREVIGCSPFLVLAASMGGISFELAWFSCLLLGTLALFLVALATTVAVIVGEAGSRTVWLVTTAAVLLGSIPLIGYANGVFATTHNPGFDWLSPVSTFVEIFSQKNSPVSTQAWLSLGWLLIEALLLLGLATLLLGQRWHRHVRSEPPSPWLCRFQAVFAGRSPMRQKHLQPLLECSPYRWLIERDRRPAWVASLGILVMVMLWIAGLLLWPQQWLSSIVFLVTGAALALVVYSLSWFLRCRQLGSDRRTGALELLLVTPLTPEEIVTGQEQALQQQSRWLVGGAMACCLALAVGGLFTRPWTAGAAVSYVLLWAWIVTLIVRTGRTRCGLPMWVALNSGGRMSMKIASPLFSALSVFAVHLLGNNRSGGMLANTRELFPTGSTIELVLVILAAVICLLVMAHNDLTTNDDEMKLKLLKYLREIAAEPPPSANDPRLAKWEPRERLPPRREVDPLATKNG